MVLPLDPPLGHYPTSSALASSVLTDCYNFGSSCSQQLAMQDRVLKPPEDVLASCSRPLIERRLKPQPDQVLKCPRCESLNTKFCYFNNYSLSQPRHFCKNCRRYWTKGGALRNVPVGGGCRKNKRAKQRIVEQSATGHQNESAPTVTLGGECSSCQPLSDNLSIGAPNSLYYSMAGDEDEISLAYAQSQVARISEQPGLATCTSALYGGPGNAQLSSFPHSNLASLSNHISSLGAIQPLRNGRLGLDFTGALRSEQRNLDLSPMSDPVPFLSSSSTATSTGLSEAGIHTFNLAFDALNSVEPDGQWKIQQQPTENGNIGDGQLLFPYENQNVESLRNSRLRYVVSGLSPCRKVEDDCRHGPIWQATHEGIFETAPDTTNFWNNGVWPDLSGYARSCTSLP